MVLAFDLLASVVVLAVRVARVLLRRSVRLPQVCYLDFPNYFHSEMVKA
jgi:hypothetical protein